MPQPWRELLNAVVYLVDDRALTDATAANLADRLLAKPLWDLTPDQQLGYLVEASESNGQLPIDAHPARRRGHP